MLVARATFRVECLGDIIPPPLTSKMIKFVIEKYGRGVLKELTLRSLPLKPLQISPLFLNDRPLYSRGEPLRPVPKGTLLTAWISLVSDPLDPSCFNLSGRYETPYGTFSLELVEVEVIDLIRYSVDDVGKFFRVDFITPTVLTNKYMVPPPLKVRATTLPSRHKLIPQPSFIFSYLLRLWNSLAPPHAKIPDEGAGDWDAYSLGRLADATLVEVDYMLRPETVVIGRDSEGRLRKVRGFTGWVIYECLSRKLLPTYAKLLKLAEYLGIGRSRGIGLGIVRVNWNVFT